MAIRGILVSSLLAVTFRVLEIIWILLRSQFGSLNALRLTTVDSLFIFKVPF